MQPPNMNYGLINRPPRTWVVDKVYFHLGAKIAPRYLALFTHAMIVLGDR